MPLERYGVLCGRPVEARREGDGDNPHYQVRVVADGTNYRLAINVKSQAHPSELLFLVDDDFRHPVTSGLVGLRAGFTPLPSRPGGLALDFIRGNLFDRMTMRALPPTLPGPDNDLSDRLEHFVRRAVADPRARLYAFGEPWGPERDRKDQIFGFRPGNGVHDIHMNQGSHRDLARDDGVWQDGALLLHLPATGQWVAVFLAFQSQEWHTDDRTGHALPTGPAPGPQPGPPAVPGAPDHLVRIVAALVNPRGSAPKGKTVTLLNASPDPVDLTGWQLADGLKNRQPLGGTLSPGATLAIKVAQPVQLGNAGGIITLLNREGLKVDGVSYTAEQARREGWTLVF
jgi:uncharacterized protein YukJ